MADDTQALELLHKQRVVTPDHPNFLPLMLGYAVRVARTGEVGIVQSYRGRYVDGRVDPASVSFQVKMAGGLRNLSMAEIEFPGWVPAAPPPVDDKPE